MNAGGVDNQYILKADKPFLILVEGPSDKAMLGQMLRAAKLNLPAYQIMFYDGKDRFKQTLENVTRQPGFVNVTHLAVLRDADDSAQDAFRSVQGRLRNSAEIPQDAVPQAIGEITAGANLKTGVFILPDVNANGALEELLLSSLDEDLRAHIVQYVTGAKNKLATDAGANFTNSTKSHSYAYSALFGVENFRDSFRKSAWDWSHQAFQPIRDFFHGFERV